MKNQRADRRKSDPRTAGPPASAWSFPGGWFAPTLLAVLTVIFLGDVLFAGKTLAMRDMFSDCLPWRVFSAKVIGSGHVPFWNPYTGYGKPFAADPQASVFYPPHLLFNLLPAVWALKLSWTLHFWIGAASMFALARHWQLQRVPALIAAVSFAFGTLLMAYLEFFAAISAAVWGPLVLLLASRLVDHCATPAGPKANLGLRHAATLALVLSVQYLAGYPEFSIQTVLMAGLLIVLRSVHHRNWASFVKASALFLFAGLLTLALVLPQFLATWELIQNSERASAVDPGLNVASVHPRHLLSLLLPFLFGRPGYPDQYWAESIFEFWLGTCYVGVLPLIVGGFTLLYFRPGVAGREPKKNILGRFAVVLLLFGLLMALGRYLPFYQFFFEHVPVFNRMRWPSKYLFWVLYALALLAGLGYQALADFGGNIRARRAHHGIAIAGLGFFAVIAGGYFWAHNDPHFLQWLAGTNFQATPAHVADVLADYRLALVFLALSLAVLLARLYRPTQAKGIDALAVILLFINLLCISRQVQPALNDSVYRPEPVFPLAKAVHPQAGRVITLYSSAQQWLYGCADEKTFEWARMAGAGDAWLPFGIYQCWQGGMKLDRYKSYQQRLYEGGPTEAARLSDLAGVRYYVRGEKSERILWENSPKVVGVQELPQALPRAYVVSRWTTIRDASQILPQLVSPSFDPQREAVVEPVTCGNRNGTDTNALVPPSNLSDTGPAQGITTLKDNLDHLELDDVRVTQKSLLVLADSWYPGWHATVDGRPQPVYRVNYLFRGVFLEPGTHRIVFSYEPWQFRSGVWASVMAAVLLATMIAWPALASPRKRPQVIRAIKNPAQP